MKLDVFACAIFKVYVIVDLQNGRICKSRGCLVSSNVKVKNFCYSIGKLFVLSRLIHKAWSNTGN